MKWSRTAGALVLAGAVVGAAALAADKEKPKGKKAVRSTQRAAQMVVLDETPGDLLKVDTLVTQWGTQEGIAKTVQVTFDLEHTKAGRFVSGRKYTIPGTKSHHCGDGYLLPRKVIVVKMDEPSDINGVRISQGQYRRVQTDRPVVAANLRVYRGNKVKRGPKQDKSAGMKPADVLTYEMATKSGGTKIVYLRIWPVHHNPATKETIIVSSMTVEIWYDPEPEG